MTLKKLLWMGTVSSLAMACAAAPSLAADSSSPDEIVVTGFRASLQNSMNVKREADGVVEAVSAEDIGQLPDKNVADALQRLPGITTITSAAAGSGGFGENDRVSVRGTAPSLTQTLINGHAVGTGDWFILDQLNAASRSVSYSMFPSEIVDHVIVYKSSQADQVEGGTAGTVDIVTRTPLGFKDAVTAEASLGGAYSDLRSKAGYQFNALANWKNDNNTVGIMVQGFDEDRFLRRDGQEVLGYHTLPTTAAWPTALQGVQVPGIINNALFTQERHRQGGDVAIEFSPSTEWDVKLDGFHSKLDASNYNQGDLVNLNDFINKGVVPSSYTVSNGVLTSATFPGSTSIGNPGINDIYRPGASSYSEYINLDGTYKPSSHLKFHFAGGYTEGQGKTDQYAYGTTSATGAGISYAMNGTNPITLGFPGAVGLNDPSNYSAFAGDGNQDWVGVTQLAQIDSEKYGQVDAEYYLDNPLINEVKAGIRYTEHDRHETTAEAYGCYSGACSPTLASVSNGQFPSNFGQGAGFTTPFTLSVDPGALETLVQNMVNSTGRTPAQRLYWQGEFKITEDTVAGYTMAKIGGDNWKGNVGVRIVNTSDKIKSYDSNPGSVGVQPQTGSDFGTYYINGHSQNYNEILPSLSVQYDVSKTVVARISAAETMTRPDYYALAGGATLNDQVLSGSQGNPALKPTKAADFDASVEWYYAPESSVSLGLFDMQMSSTFDQGTIQEKLVNLALSQNPLTNPCGLACPVYSTYTVTAPINNSGYSQGFELSWQQPLMYGFGFVANYTYADSAQDTATPGIGGHTLLGAAKHTANVTGYYQDELINAHLAYTQHSDIYEGIDRATKYYLKSGGTMDGSINFKITKNFGVNLDVLNILDQKETYFAGGSPELPRAVYDFGRTFYFAITAKY